MQPTGLPTFSSALVRDTNRVIADQNGKDLAALSKKFDKLRWAYDNLIKECHEQNLRANRLAQGLGFQNVLEAMIVVDGEEVEGHMKYKELVERVKRSEAELEVLDGVKTENERLKEEIKRLREEADTIRVTSMSNTKPQSGPSFPSKSSLQLELEYLQANFDALLKTKERAAERYKADYRKWKHFKEWVFNDEKQIKWRLALQKGLDGQDGLTTSEQNHLLSEAISKKRKALIELEPDTDWEQYNEHTLIFTHTHANKENSILNETTPVRERKKPKLTPSGTPSRKKLFSPSPSPFNSNNNAATRSSDFNFKFTRPSTRTVEPAVTSSSQARNALQSRTNTRVMTVTATYPGQLSIHAPAQTTNGMVDGSKIPGSSDTEEDSQVPPFQIPQKSMLMGGSSDTEEECSQDIELPFAVLPPVPQTNSNQFQTQKQKQKQSQSQTRKRAPSPRILVPSSSQDIDGAQHGALRPPSPRQPTPTQPQRKSFFPEFGVDYPETGKDYREGGRTIIVNNNSTGSHALLERTTRQGQGQGQCESKRKDPPRAPKKDRERALVASTKGKERDIPREPRKDREMAQKVKEEKTEPVFLRSQDQGRIETPTRLEQKPQVPMDRTPRPQEKATDAPSSTITPVNREAQKLNLLNDYSAYKGRGRYAQDRSAQRSINALYTIDPTRNGGVDFRYEEVVRTKDDRRKMDAGDCECCRDYYEAIGPLPQRLHQPLWRSPPNTPVKPCQRHHQHLPAESASASRNRNDGLRGAQSESETESQKAVASHKQAISRHRHHWARASTPPGYWNIDFPTTQEAAEINEQAEEMHQKKRKDVEKEVRTDGGKYRKK